MNEWKKERNQHLFSHSVAGNYDSKECAFMDLQETVPTEDVQGDHSTECRAQIPSAA